jgi:sodium-dependent phosphate cotransporter
VHTVFNVAGILILYVVPFMRPLPILAAEKLADVAVERRSVAFIYVIGTFIVVPLVGLAIFR